MPAFNPHIGNSPGGFTAQPLVAVTGLLDSIVSDLGSGINGWSLYDDMRVSGSSTPLYPPVQPGTNGILNYYDWGANNLYSFTSGSQQALCNNADGFNWYYAISGLSGSPTPLSLDKVNWYNAYYSGWPSNTITATLDRNYAAATTRTSFALYQKMTKYVVLQCSSSQKTFYLLLGQMTERAGAPILYTQVWETWNSGTHSGTNPSAMEHTRVILDGIAPLTLKMLYIAWFFPDTFALWTQGAPTNNYGTNFATFTYVGNLDTTGAKSGDTDALAFIAGDTTLSSMGIYYLPFNYYVRSTTGYPSGGSQCLRTYSGTLWGGPTGNNAWTSIGNQYQVYPRGHWYGLHGLNPPVDVGLRYWINGLDMYHVGAYDQSAPVEGRRGALRYVKIPTFPMHKMGFEAIGPFNDGRVYIQLTMNAPFINAVYANPMACATQGGYQWLTPAASQIMCSGWTAGWKNANQSNGASNYNGFAEIMCPNSIPATMFFNTLLMPISP